MPYIVTDSIISKFKLKTGNAYTKEDDIMRLLVLKSDRAYGSQLTYSKDVFICVSSSATF